MNIIVIVDGASSSATIVMKGIAEHSKHELQIVDWNPAGHITRDTDIIYYHYGGILNERHPYLLKGLKQRPHIKKIAGIRGVMNFRKWITDWNTWPVTTNTTFKEYVYDLDAISVANQRFYDGVMTVDPSIPTYLCHSGVDTTRFKPSPMPEEFCLGWAGWAMNGAKMYNHYMELPFCKKTAAVDGGTYKLHKDMHEFYPHISLYVSTSVEEGCPVPPLEAAASGRPVIGIDVGCLNEWVPEKMLVPLVDPSNSYKALIPLIQSFIDHPSQLIKYGKWFRELSLKFDFKVIAKEYDHMFEEVIDNARDTKDTRSILQKSNEKV